MTLILFHQTNLVASSGQITADVAASQTHVTESERSWALLDPTTSDKSQQNEASGAAREAFTPTLMLLFDCMWESLYKTEQTGQESEF